MIAWSVWLYAAQLGSTRNALQKDVLCNDQEVMIQSIGGSRRSYFILLQQSSYAVTIWVVVLEDAGDGVVALEAAYDGDAVDEAL